MFNLILTISVYCIAINNPIYITSKRKCIKELRQCVNKKQQSPLGNVWDYLEECVTERENHK